ncbi:hypothetical protein ACWDTP_23630 [Mycobacterium sp. NPDC003449]
MTRRQIDAARPETVLAMARSWKSSAAGLATAAETYQTNVRNPGGQPWSGLTTNAAIRMAGNDRTAIDNLRQAIDTMADASIDSINDPVIPNLNDVRSKISSAEAAGFTVNDDLTITFVQSTPPDPQRQEDAERRAAEIGAAATKWWNADQAVADQINHDKQGLAVRLNSDRDPNSAEYERRLREAGLLTGPPPSGYYAQWLANAERAGISPDEIVKIAQRFEITPDSFTVLDGMKEIKDRDGKSFFLLPEGAGGDDARQATLMTYILNARTDYGAAGRKPDVKNSFAETPYSADEIQRIIDRQEDNSWSYSQDVAFVHGNGGRLVTTPNGMMMGLGGNGLQDLYSQKAGTTWGDTFMLDIDDPADPAAQLEDVVESGQAWYVDDDGDAYAGNLDLDRLLHHEERHSQQWADYEHLGMAWKMATDSHGLEEDAGLADGGYH